MADESSPLIRSLQQVSGEINQESDQLTESLAKLESLIGGLNLGVSACVPLYPDEKLATQGFFYGKVGDAWHLGVEDAAGKRRPLRECARPERIAAAAQIDHLLGVLLAETQRLAEKISKARGVADQAAMRLGGKS